MRRKLDPKDVFVGGRKIENVFRPGFMTRSLFCFVPAAILTIFWHSILASMLGFMLVFLGVFVFIGAWQEVVEATYATYAPTNPDRKYTVRIETGRIQNKLLFFAPLVSAVAYFALTLKWLV